MTRNSVAIELSIQLEDASQDELGELARNLRDQLSELPTEHVDFVRRGEMPVGAKAVDPVTFAAIALAVLPGLLPKVVEFIDHFTTRTSGVRITVTRRDGSVALEFPSNYAPERLKAFLDVAQSATTD